MYIHTVLRCINYFWMQLLTLASRLSMQYTNKIWPAFVTRKSTQAKTKTLTHTSLTAILPGLAGFTFNSHSLYILFNIIPPCPSQTGGMTVKEGVCKVHSMEGNVAEILMPDALSRDVLNGFFKFGSILRKTAGSVRFWKTVRSVFFVDQL